MTRRKIRENLYVLLFQADFHEQEHLLEQVDIYLEDLKTPDATKKAKGELRERFLQVIPHIEEIDKKIEEKSKGWSISRIAKSDLAVLRLAMFEIMFDEKVPTGVAINEAVELAKMYGTDKSTGFVNGILSTVAKEFPETKQDNTVQTQHEA